MLTKLYRNDGPVEVCFNIDSTTVLSEVERRKIGWLIARQYAGLDARVAPSFTNSDVVEIGPRLAVETPSSSNAIAICRTMGLTSVTRIEESIRYRLLAGQTREAILARYLDRMTQAEYPNGIASFDLEVKPVPVQIIPVLAEGAEAVRKFNSDMGLGMDEADIEFTVELFHKYGVNPTDVGLVQLGNMNSEHCRHKLWKGRIVIDGVVMPETLLDLVREPLRRRNGQSNSVLAFNDNAGAMLGPEIWGFVPEHPGEPSRMVRVRMVQYLTATAETHNHPTAIAPYPGAATKDGGEIRDEGATGRGSRFGMAVAGYCFGNLHLPDYLIPGELVGGENLPNYASPLKVLIEGTNGSAHYSNAFGRPLVGGICRGFGLMVAGERREYRKPVFYGGGVGTIDARHVIKGKPEVGMLIIRFGGPAFNIGLCGGSASSMMQGENKTDLDFNSVQRGNPEMENRANRVITTCTDMGDLNIIVAISDQGASGQSNDLTELIEALGGNIDIAETTLGDKTMADLAIWSAEFQESYGVIVRREDAWLFKKYCARERVSCDVMGEITGDHRIKVINSRTNTVLVDLDLRDVLTHAPQKTFKFERIERKFEPFILPADQTVEQLIQTVFKLPQVGSKGFLVRKIDRSVTGRVVSQPCCGPTQVPVADVGVQLNGYFDNTGVAEALGEQPNVMLIDPAAGARMSFGEMLTNMCAAKISGIPDIKTRLNQMGAFKLPGEGARLWDANVAVRSMVIALGGAEEDGGKDSSAMAAKVNGKMVKAPSQMIVLGYAPVPDCDKVLTPDFKYPGLSSIGFIDLGHGKNRLGGSSLAQAFGQVGDTPPDVDDVAELRRAFEAVQELIDRGLISAYHDRSDGGLVTTLVEMCLAGNCGASIFFEDDKDGISTLFNQELGMTFEYLRESEDEIQRVFSRYKIQWANIGWTRDDDSFFVRYNGRKIVNLDSGTLRTWWEATSSRLELEQSNPETVRQESETYANPLSISYEVTFTPRLTRLGDFGGYRPKVAVLREEGTNGDLEMKAAFDAAGCDAWDINMEDLLTGKITLDDFQGLAAAGGFSYMDVFESGKGWAAGILFNPLLQGMFDRFYNRPDTFSLGVCNGAQFLPLIRWVPFKDMREEEQPRFVQNVSQRFESRWSLVKVLASPSIFFTGMEGSVLGVHVDHGEGQMVFPDISILKRLNREKLVPLAFVEPQDHQQTERYPYNPNGSPMGLTAMCTPDGRNTVMMPHPERVFLKLQWHYLPEHLKQSLEASPWLQMFQNARKWCAEHRVK